jgi:WhiB family redox-sensing transcriptional regulator
MIDYSEANCVVNKTPVEVFFPEGAEMSNKDYAKAIATAKAVCVDCPVAVQCLQAALAENEYGIWAGTTMEERRSMRKGIVRKPLNILRNPNRK